MTRIVTTTYRYKRPPKRKGRKLAEITGPAVVTSVDPKKSSRRAVLAETAAKEELSTRSPAGDTEPSTPPGKMPAPANDDGPRKLASVIARKPGSRFSSDVPDMTPEEHQRRGDAADALFREMKRQIAGARRGALPPPPLKKPG
jgi:hypothetical protein